jgi:hypothetical protein
MAYDIRGGNGKSYGPMGINSSIKEPKGTQGGSPSNLAANSNKYNFSVNPNVWKVTKMTAHQKLIFKVQKLVEALS